MKDKKSEKLKGLRKEYERIHMSDIQRQGMMKRIAEAKKENYGSRINHRWMSATMAAAAALAICMLPNLSGPAARVMGNAPVLGGFFRMITFREYHFDQADQIADVGGEGIDAWTGRTVYGPSLRAGQLGNGSGEDDLEEEDGQGKAGEGASQKKGHGKGGKGELLTKEGEGLDPQIRAMTDKWVDHFKTAMEKEGYQDLTVSSEVVQSTDRYFTLKLSCEEEADSDEGTRYYTIDLQTGNRLALKELFVDGSDYIETISKSIRIQMKEQMEEDDSIGYRLDDIEMGEDDPGQITDKTEFYVNEDGKLVIHFDEGEVAPASMGIVEFEIPQGAVRGIWAGD